jgi:hypothetical protein
MGRRTNARRYHLLAEALGFQGGRREPILALRLTFIMLKNLQNQHICHVLI